MRLFSKNQEFSEEKFCQYLVSKNFNKENEDYIFENEHTGVYFSIEKQEKEEHKDVQNLADFYDTRYLCCINFLRPNFFGIETFNFIDNLIDNFNLYILDRTEPEEDKIFKPQKDQLYTKWRKVNNYFSREEFANSLYYYPEDRMNLEWEYNFSINSWQKELGENYFVPRIAYIKKKTGNKVFSVTTWTQNIPTVLPKGIDYVIINKQIKSFFGGSKLKPFIVSYKDLMKDLGNFFSEYKEGKAIIIYPENASKLDKKFNNISSNEKFVDFEVVTFDKITNTPKEKILENENKSPYITFKCPNCEKDHIGPPSFELEGPDNYIALSPEDKSNTLHTTDLCQVGNDYFIRCILEVPIKDMDENFTWGVWVSQSKENFEYYSKHINDDLSNRKTFGWLCNNLPGYSNTFGLETTVQFQSNNLRPVIHIHESENQLSQDFHGGMTLEKALDIAGKILHAHSDQAQ